MPTLPIWSLYRPVLFVLFSAVLAVPLVANAQQRPGGTGSGGTNNAGTSSGVTSPEVIGYVGTNSDCYGYDPEWDEVYSARTRLQASTTVPSDVKSKLLARLAELERKNQEFIYGTAPYCVEDEDYISQVETHNLEIDDQTAQVATYDTELARYTPQCTETQNDAQYNTCYAWYESLNATHGRLETWRVKLENNLTRLNDWNARLQKQMDDINTEWEGLLRAFVTDANKALAGAK